MSTDQNVRLQDWVKAALSAALFLAVLFLLITRSSCTSDEGAGTANDSEPGGNEGEVASSEVGNPGKGKENSKTDKQESASNAKDASQPEKDATEGPTTAAKQSPPTEKKSVPANSSFDNAESKTAHAKTKSSSEPRGASIGGLKVKGKKLGVILDVSGSMQRYLPSLRSEIRSRFTNPVFLEVEGCLIEPSSFDRNNIVTARRSNPKSRASVMNSFRELVELYKVDSIYWFCDLQDERTQAGLTELMQLVHRGGSNSPAFHLYVRSTDDVPDPELEDIILISGGAFEKRK